MTQGVSTVTDGKSMRRPPARYPRSGTLAERFWPRVNVGEPDDCWLWKGCSTPERYGKMMYLTVQYKAHRLAYAISHGLALEDLPEAVDHMCRVPACVNPRHLQGVTQAENCQNRSNVGIGKSGIRGVLWIKARKKWIGLVRCMGIDYYTIMSADKEVVRDALVELRLRVQTNNLEDRIAVGK